MTPEAERVLRERAGKLAALGKHTAWEELIAEFDRREVRDVKAITAQLVAGTPLEIAQRDIDYARGYHDALKWVQRLPAEAEKRLEKALLAAQDGNEVNG